MTEWGFEGTVRVYEVKGLEGEVSTVDESWHALMATAKGFGRALPYISNREEAGESEHKVRAWKLPHAEMKINTLFRCSSS